MAQFILPFFYYEPHTSDSLCARGRMESPWELAHDSLVCANKLSTSSQSFLKHLEDVCCQDGPGSSSKSGQSHHHRHIREIYCLAERPTAKVDSP